MTHSRAGLLAVLRRKLELLEGLRPPPDIEPLSTGVPELDRLLPAGGLRQGTLVEYLAGGTASGTVALACAAARAACDDGQACVVVDRLGQFYPLAAVALGIDLARLIVVRPASATGALWAVDQALRCPGVGAVCCWCSQLGGRDCRRLQLAAESGQTLGLLVRPTAVRRQPTWADVQWLVQPLPSRGYWRVSVELARCRGGTSGARVELELDEARGTWGIASDTHATPLVHLPAALAPAAPARQRSRA